MTLYTISLDPGTRQAGLALFEGDRLVDAYLGSEYPGNLLERYDAVAADLINVVESQWKPRFKKPQNVQVVQEVPQFYAYGSSRTPGSGDDILALCLVCGAFGMSLVERGFSRPSIYRPAQWKNQVEKEAMCARIVDCLAPCEVAVLEKFRAKRGKKLINHNVVDGVGVGMKKLKRIPVAGTPMSMWKRTDADFK